MQVLGKTERGSTVFCEEVLLDYRPYFRHGGLTTGSGSW